MERIQDMKIWMKKLFIAFITVITFGLFTPFQSYSASNDRVPDSSDDTKGNEQVEINNISNYSPPSSTCDQIISTFTYVAKQQSMIKFGDKIRLKIEDQFYDDVFPQIEKVIEQIVQNYPENKRTDLAMTEYPGIHRSEKIFNIYDRTTLTDIARFHVSRLHLPKEGFVFHFHYHMYHDQFEKHFNLGKIYWGKNTPPKWMS